MTYQQAGSLAIAKRILGWIIFIPALVSTLISVMLFLEQSGKQRSGINAVMQDFAQVMIDMIRFNTGFLAAFWKNSPLPDFNGADNPLFWGIYMLIFVGLAMQASGARMWRQARFLRESIADRMILEKARGSEGQSRTQLEEKIVVPRHTLFLQIFPLYLLPLMVAAVGYFVLKLAGFIG